MNRQVFSIKLTDCRIAIDLGLLTTFKIFDVTWVKDFFASVIAITFNQVNIGIDAINRSRRGIANR